MCVLAFTYCNIVGMLLTLMELFAIMGHMYLTIMSIMKHRYLNFNVNNMGHRYLTFRQAHEHAQGLHLNSRYAM